MPQALNIAYEALYLMGGAIDWAGLPIVADMLGIEDIDSAVRLMRMVIINERKK